MMTKKEKKRVPELRFEGFEGEWEKESLNEVALIITGSTPSTSKREYYNGSKLFVSPVDIQSNRYVSETKTTLTELGFSKGRKVPKGSVLFVSIGSTIGKVGQAKEELITNQQINSLIAINNNSNDFIYSLLEKKGARIKGLAGVQAVPLVNKTDFSALKYYFPKPNEQQKIATFLTSIDTRIQQLEKKKTLLEQYKKGVMQKIFSQEIRFKDDDGKEFGEWEEKKLKQVADIVKGKQLNREELTETGKYACQNGGINPSGYTDKFNTLQNTITISEGGNSCGYVNFMTSKFWCGGHCYSLVNLKKVIINKYLFQYLKYNQKGIMRLRVGSGLPNIQRRDIINFKIRVPCLAEQTKIAHFLSAIDKKITVMDGQIEKTKEWKKGLLQRMFV